MVRKKNPKDQLMKSVKTPLGKDYRPKKEEMRGTVDEMLRLYTVDKVKQQLQEKHCPVCDFTNAQIVEFCVNCGSLLHDP